MPERLRRDLYGPMEMLLALAGQLPQVLLYMHALSPHAPLPSALQIDARAAVEEPAWLLALAWQLPQVHHKPQVQLSPCGLVGVVEAAASMVGAAAAVGCACRPHAALLSS